MRATDKQIAYLTNLTEKLNNIIDLWPECGAPKCFLDWRHERSMGMNINDASIRIKAFHTLLCGINMKRALLNLPQF